MVTTNSLFDIHAIYQHTTLALGIECLIMGITLLTLSLVLKHGRTRYNQALIFLAAAMFVLSIINIAEHTIGTGSQANHLFAVTVFAASIEMFLLFFAYMFLLNRTFITRRRMCIEVGLIAVFTAPALFVSQDNQPALFNTLFGIGAAFYAVKLIVNLFAYRKQIRKTTEEIENYFSQESSELLSWVNHTFYMVLAIGGVSVVVPITNLPVLTLYNASLFFAYFYLYISVIRNIDLFDKSMKAVESNDDESTLPESGSKQRDSSIALQQRFLDKWMEEKGFCVSGLTASEVAVQLHINRTKLSRYLKEELQTNYYDWIAGLRMEEAKKQLIEYPEKSIINIAHDVGIEDRYNFGRMFQRFAGMSPTAYRKECFEKTHSTPNPGKL